MFILRLLDSIFQTILKPCILYLFKIYYELKPRKKLPPIEDPLLLKPANHLVTEIRNHQLKCENLIKAYIDRIKQVQPILNCVVDERFDEAIKEAKQIDEMIMSGSHDLSLYPLLGIPFTCKELTWMKGLHNSAGLVKRKNVVSTEDAEVIRLMKQAGGILLCATNISELGLWFESTNYVYGTTKNPYDTRRMVGGSSGGEGCLISACGSLIGIGSDIGGSIRMPAFFNGIFGHKPTANIVNNQGNHPPDMTPNQEYMLVLGPLCRYAEDLELVFNVLSASKRSYLAEAPQDLASLNFYFIDHMDGYFVSQVCTEVKEAQLRVIEFIEKKYSKKVKRYRPRFLYSSFLMWLSMASEGVDKNQVSKLMSDSDTPKNPWIEVIKAVFLQSTHTCPTLALSLLEKLPISEADQKKYLDLIKKAREEMNILLRQSGILLFPGFPSEAPYHNQALWTNPVDWIAYYGIINALGLPSTQVCLGLSKNGLPIGIQLISNINCDYLSIKLAVEVERALGGWCQP